MEKATLLWTGVRDLQDTCDYEELYTTELVERKLVVLGGGESGVGAAILGAKLGYMVFLSDSGMIAEKYMTMLNARNINFEQGGHSMDRILQADLVVKSPGIPDNVVVIKMVLDKGIRLISEIEFAGLNSDAKFICITGSNGKTTTTLLTHHILESAGRSVGLAGNVGQSLALQIAESDKPCYVVELSSFQLDTMFDFKADIAVITNITPDHLDRYEYRMDKYVDAKFRILNNMSEDDLFIHSIDNDVVVDRCAVLNIRPECASFTYSEQTNLAGAWREGNMLKARLGDRDFEVEISDISIGGRHNVYNAMVAVLISLRMGLRDENIRVGLNTFPQVEHRLEKFATKDGINYINDSKATNVDSTWYALDSVETSIIWIAGGTDKGNDYECLHSVVKSRVKLLIAMGKDNSKLVKEFTDICPIVDVHSLDDAVKAVFANAQMGDTVLLSPCCASFDLFKNYEDRGTLFKKAINERLYREN